MISILIVEDELAHSELIRRAFDAHTRNVNLTVVGTLVDAKTYVDSHSIDIALADWLLPDGKGVELLAQGRELLPYPVLIMTSHGNEEVAVETMKAGALDYVVKSPATFADMPRIVERSMREWGHIVARKRAEMEAYRTATELRTYIDAAGQGVIVINQDCQMTLVNQEAEHIFGLTREAMTGQSVEMLFPKSQRELSMTTVNLYLVGEDNSVLKTYELDGLHKDSHIFPLEMNLSSLVAEDKRSVIALFTDITQRKRLEAEALEAKTLQVRLEKEIEIRQYKNLFLSMFSHEFRTPLTIIKTNTDLVKRYYDRLEPQKREQKLNVIGEQVDKLNEMINDILLLNKTDAMHIEFKPELVNISEFCHKIVSDRLIPNQSHNITMNIRGSQEKGWIDCNLMDHILTNLLANAIKYSPSQSEVRLDIQLESQEIEFRISDNGIGIPVEDQNRVFEPFHRAKNVGNINGTGMGLAIVKEFVELHRGQITFLSDVGAGTTFTVTIPNKARQE